jgi:hypothetical protein
MMISNKLVLALAGTAALLGGVALAGPKEAAVTVAKDAKWVPIDPKAGDKGPMLAVLFGDPTKKAPIGFLLKLPAGSKPGPHTHTSDDYGVVVQGKMHNYVAPGTDEGPTVEPGGYWFQPGGKPHDNHCEGPTDCIISVYMPNGFDVKPWTAPAGKDPKKDAPKDAPKDAKKDAPKK